LKDDGAGALAQFRKGKEGTFASIPKSTRTEIEDFF
jgi:hypothetical protein